MPDNDNLTNQNIKNNPKIMKAWAYYDWANSVYSLVITSTLCAVAAAATKSPFASAAFVSKDINKA